MERKMQETIAGLYYMPTVRANVFVCSAVGTEDGRLHVNALVFHQSLRWSGIW